MRRLVKFGFFGLILAAVAGGTLTWASQNRTVTLRVDGQVRTIHTTAASVRAVLADARISVASHDLVAPELNARIGGDAQIVISRGHQLDLTVDGRARRLWVNADSVAEALGQLGYGRNEFVSVSRSRRLDSGVTRLQVDTPKKITIKADKRTVTVMSAGPTVADAISDAGFGLGARDIVSADVTSPIHSGEVITVKRVVYKPSTKTEQLPYQTVRKPDSGSWIGTTQVIQPGRTGTAIVNYQVVYIDGKVAGRIMQHTGVVTPPTNQVEAVGTKTIPQSMLDMIQVPNQKIAAGMLVDRGWGTDQFGCLINLWDKESGWRTDAANPSGAYGIPQALPGSKMASVGADWQTSAVTQITWGLQYISGVYGTPCAAWAHSQASNWY